jgi:hypothetical protein
VQAVGKIPHISDAGKGVQGISKAQPDNESDMLTSCGRTAQRWLRQIADRIERVRITHGEWSRCLNHHFGGDNTAVFLDPPYRAYEKLYGSGKPVADEVEEWVRENAHLRIALCGHIGDYKLDEWDAVEWSRGRLTYGGDETTDQECIWYSPACLQAQHDLFSRKEPPRLAATAGAIQ